MLLVTYAFPPSRLVGAMRWGTMTKYLGRLGFEVTVLTSRRSGGGPQPGVRRVIRPSDLESGTLLRRLTRRPDRQSREGGAASGATWLERAVVPDGWLLTWVPFALGAAWREVRRGGVDCIVTTSPGESTHLIGHRLRRMGPAWIADFRDGWIFEPARPAFTSASLRALDERLERAVVTGTDRVVAVTEELTADFRRRLGVDAVCIPNGWDPEVASSDYVLEHSPMSSRKARLVYTGQFGAGTARRSPEPFVAALERFYELEPRLAAELEVVVAGARTLQDEVLLSSLARRGAVRHVGEAPYEEAVRLQRSADALVLWAEGSIATTKLFDYLATGHPILHVGSDGAAARILRETRSGITVSPDDIEGIVDRLREIARGDFGEMLEPRGLDQYSYPRLAESMAAVIDDAVSRRRIPGRRQRWA